MTDSGVLPEAIPHPHPHPADRPVRVLFVFAWLAGGAEETLLRRLAQALDRARYRIDALPCLRRKDAPDPTHAGLAALGIDVDLAAYDLGFEDTVRYLAGKIAGYEIIVSCQDVADIYPALERLRHRPPLIEYGRETAEAKAGPKHLTTRYVGMSEQVSAAAALRMPDRAHHARTIAMSVASVQRPDWWGSALVRLGLMSGAAVPDPVSIQWAALFEEVLTETPAPPPKLFRSFLQGGFECSTHRLQTGRRLDVIAATAHDTLAESDYRQLGQLGLRTVRDGLRWHLVEAQPGHHDFTSFLPMVQAAQRTGTQVIWDLLHYGWPDDIDIWTPAFVDRFAAYARATAQAWRDTTDEVPFWCPINEISFFSWGGGDVRCLNPFATDRGFELKAQLIRASVTAIHALREIDPRARFVQCEPLIAIHHDAALGFARDMVEGLHQEQFQAFDMLSGRICPHLAGDPSMLDIIGVNYYPRNQWIHSEIPIDMDHPSYRPLSDLLFETHARYLRPIFVSETGAEDDHRAPWLRYVAAEVLRARRRGVPVEGLCLYPILNHPGWDDDRDCQNGLLTQLSEGAVRGLDPALSLAVREVAAEFSSLRNF